MAVRGATPKVVVASDSFKGSLSSHAVGDAVRLGVLDVAPCAEVVVVPVADGGEGTVAAAVAHGWSPVAVEVHGPTGAPVWTVVAIRAQNDGPIPRIDTAAPHHSSVDSTAAPRNSSVDSTAAPHHSSVDSTAAPHHSSVDSTAAPRNSSVDTRERTPEDPADLPPVTALVEMADACGLGRLPDAVPAPLTASSRGLGDAIRAALDLGAAEIIVGVGGSASTDGGAGMLAALGARMLDADGTDLPEGGAALAGLGHLDLSDLDPRLATTRLVLAADVESPLLGPSGAAAVFAPQKGATAAEVELLEAALTHWASVVEAHPTVRPPAVARSTEWSLQGPEQGPGVPRSTSCSVWGRMPGAGAAGGVGFALLAVLGAERASGIEVVLDLVGLDAALVCADLVVTGEGSLDTQTLSGKAVKGVAQRAAAHGIPVVAVCGRLALDEDGLAALGVRAAYPLSDLEPELETSVRDASALLRRTGSAIARDVTVW